MLGTPCSRSVAPLAILLFAAQYPAQSQFRIQSNTVVVDVIVTDSKGNVVPGLTADQFKISENGAAQKIIGFETPSVAARGGSAREREAATPAESSPKAPRMQLVTLVVDLGDTRTQGLNDSLKAATDYVKKVVTEEDYVALYAIDSRLRLVVPYTRDKDKLTEGIKSLTKSANQGASTARDRELALNQIAKLQSDEASMYCGDPGCQALAEMTRMERLSLMTEMSLQSTFQAKAVFIALRSIALAAGTLPGRKNVILFSEGFLHSDDAEGAMAAVISAANRSNVAFYVVDPSGLNAASNNLGGGIGAENESNSASAGAGVGRRAPNTAATRQAEFARMGPQVVGGQTKFDWARTAMALDAIGADMEDLASATGGFVVKSNSPLFSLERIDRDLREHYTLTYQPAETDFDGKFRKIQVDVEGKGLRVRYRKGYWALAPGEEMRLTPSAAQLVAAAMNGSLKPTIAPLLNTSVVFGAALNEVAVPFSVWLPGDTSWVTKTETGYASGITVVVTARDAQGKLLDAYQKFVDFQASKDKWRDYEKNGLQLMASLSIPELQSADIQAIVQFSNGKAALASTKAVIAAASSARATGIVVTPYIEAAKGESMIPALRISNYDLVLPKEQRFASGAKVVVYFGLDGVEIEPTSGRPLLSLSLAIKSGDRVVKELEWSDGLYPWPQSKDRLFFLKQYDLAGLAAGEYTVEARVRDRKKDATTIQVTPFAVK